MNHTSDRTLSGYSERAARDPEMVADYLDACFRDQARSGQGWSGLQQEMLSAMRHIADAEDLWVWGGDGGETRDEESRRHLLAAAVNLLAIASQVETMRRGMS